jgi:hypothetical protein
MSLKSPEFPSAATMNTTTMAIVAVGYVLAATAPHVRNFRDLQRAVKEAKTAAIDAYKKAERVQASMAQAQASMAQIDKLEPNTAVHRLRTVRADVVRFLDDLDLFLLAADTVASKVDRLRHYRAEVIRTAPDFDKAAAQLDEGIKSLEPVRESADDLREGILLEQIDTAVNLAIETASAYAMGRSLEISLARAGKRPTAAEALASLKKVHDFARTHGVKLGADAE